MATVHLRLTRILSRIDHWGVESLLDALIDVLWGSRGKLKEWAGVLTGVNTMKCGVAQ